jgi:hypothetical protein
MELLRGDYVSCSWVCSSGDVLWSITIVKRLLTGLWETLFTWDKTDNGRVICRTLAHRIVADGGLAEELVVARIEQIVGTIESQRQCDRLAFIEIKSGDPEVIIQKLYEAAYADERLGFFVVVRDQLPHT